MSASTARRAELPFQQDLEQHHHQMTSTPRPSVSPLSNRSPVLTRDTATNNHEPHEPSEPPKVTTAESGDIHDDDDDDDGSSSLSDPEDDQDEEERIVNDIGEDGEITKLAVQQSHEEDSEAETERLDQTPHKFGRTPSKLSHAATMEDELSEPPSPLQMDVGAASSTSTIGTLGKKRKRSEDGDSPLTSAESDLEESPRKRSYEGPPKPEREETKEEGVDNDTVEAIAETAEEVAPTPAPVVLTKAVKGRKGKPKGRTLKEAHTESEVEPTEEPTTVQLEVDTPKGEGEPEPRTIASSAFEGVAKQFTAFRDRLYTERLASMNAELALLAQPNCQHPEYLRQVACVDARRAKQLREAQAYYHYRLTSVKQRTLGDRSLLQSQYHQDIRELREGVMKKLGEDWYGIQRERREQFQDEGERYVYKFPGKRGEQVRRQGRYNLEVSVLSGVAKYVGFPAAPEIGGAEGEGLEEDFRGMKVSPYSPLPSAHAPQLLTTTAPQIAKRVPQPTAVPLPAPSQQAQQPLYHRLPATAPTQNEALAHQQYIEANAWAQPQRPIIHNHGTPGGLLTHTPDWVDRPGNSNLGAARGVIRNLSGGVRTGSPYAGGQQAQGSPYATPLGRKQMGSQQEMMGSEGAVGVGSDGVEIPGAGEGVGTGMGERVGAPMPHPGPLHVNKQRRETNGNGNGVELTGYRNISNISGASTIDAPQHPDSVERKSLPTLLSEASAAPQQVFETSGLHAHGVEGGVGVERRDVYASLGFRPHQEGAFGTPAPLTSAAP